MRGRERTPQALFAYDSLVQKLRSTLLAILRTKATGMLENEILTTFSLERTSSFWKVRAFLLLHFGKEVRPKVRTPSGQMSCLYIQPRIFYVRLIWTLILLIWTLILLICPLSST